MVLYLSFKYPIENLELVFFLTNFEMIISSALTSKIVINFLQHKTFLLIFMSLQISSLLYYGNNFCDYCLGN